MAWGSLREPGGRCEHAWLRALSHFPHFRVLSRWGEKALRTLGGVCGYHGTGTQTGTPAPCPFLSGLHSESKYQVCRDSKSLACTGG